VGHKLALFGVLYVEIEQCTAAQMREAHLDQNDISSRARDVINKLNRKTEKPDSKLVESG
jgi:hypothetical protein